MSEVLGWQIAEKSWDTGFLGQRVGALTLNESDGPTGFQSVALACAAADASGYELLECHLNTQHWSQIRALEAEGFRLVDSRAQFLTHIRLSDIEMIGPKRGSIRNATPRDRARIIELTHECFTHNNQFHSRFKDRRFFEEDLARRWFEAWVDNTLFRNRSCSAVFETNDRVEGYSIYCPDEPRDGLPVYKAILTAVSPEARGSRAQLAMQEHLYGEFNCPEWFVDNTTQISNIPMINNHIRTQKVLDQMVLTYYRTANA